MSKTHPVGSLEHAMAYAVQHLGMETVARICDRSPSAIYRGINPDDPLSLSWLTLEHVEALGQALLGRCKPEFFSSALHQRIEQGASAMDSDVDDPLPMLVEVSDHLGRALRLLVSSLRRDDESKTLREQEAVLIAEALGSVMNYARRARTATLKRMGEKPEPPSSPSSIPQRRRQEKSGASSNESDRPALPATDGKP